jgi:hypothetical protein
MAIDTLNLKTPVPCVQGFFNERLVTYTTQVSPKQIGNLLGHDPRSKHWKRLPSDELRQIYEFLQRKTSKARRDGVAGYIEERIGPDALTLGAFPSISIAFQKAAEFLPYEGGVPSAVGQLMVDISPSNVRVLIDGLGRVTGALDLIEEVRRFLGLVDNEGLGILMGCKKGLGVILGKVFGLYGVKGFKMIATSTLLQGFRQQVPGDGAFAGQSQALDADHGREFEPVQERFQAMALSEVWHL